MLSLFVPIFISYLLPLACWGCGVLSVSKRSETDPPVHKKRKERKESFHSCGSKKRDFSDDDDDDEGVYIFLSEKKMAQRSPRKSLQLNRANTPINFSGPMQDVNVSSASFFF